MLAGAHRPTLTALLASACFQDIPVDTDATSTSTADATTVSATSTATDGATTADSATEGELEPATAFRLTSLAFVDPHLYFMLDGMTCSDITALLNGAGIAPNIEDGSLNLVLLIHPLELDSAAPTLRISEANCLGDVCSDVMGSPIATTKAERRLEGACDGVVEGSRNPDYIEPMLAVSEPPCLISEPTDFAFRIDQEITRLPLEQMVITASYGEGTLIRGTLRGWLSEAAIKGITGEVSIYPFNLWETIAGAGGCQLNDPPIDDLDDLNPNGAKVSGVWIYFNFEAAEITWL